MAWRWVKNVTDAYERAFLGDTVSAFGGILAFNKEVDAKLASAMAERKHFVEVVIAPSFSNEAKELFKTESELAPIGNRWHAEPGA